MVGGLAIGMVQSLVLGYAAQPSTTWIPSWLPTTGLQQAVPVVAIIAVLALRGDALPDRATVIGRRLPPSPTPRRVTLWAAALSVAVVVGLETFGAANRQALIVSMVFALLALSVVVITGYVGQISLAPLAFAGVAGFTVIHFANSGVPFPLAALGAALVATVLGVLVGLPITRVRGMSLAVATLAIAVAIEGLVLASPSFSGGPAGMSAPRPSLFGVDLGIGALGDAELPPGVRVHGARRARAGVRGRGEPATEPHGAALAGRAGQRAGSGRGGHRRDPREARRRLRCRRSWPGCAACSWPIRRRRCRRPRSW